MNRITEKDLQRLIDSINERTGSPMKPWGKDDVGDMVANIGNYHLSGAYGGVCLHRMHNKGGGVTTPLIPYHVPKRVLYGLLEAFLAGMDETGR